MKREMRKSSKVFLTIALCFHLVVTLPVATFFIYISIPLTHSASGFVWSTDTDFYYFRNLSGQEVQMPNNRDKRILLLSDLDIGFVFNESTFRRMDKIIDQANPDLIILAGNNIGNFFNHMATTQLINRMDGYEIPWAPILSRADERGKADRNYLANMLGNTSFGLFLYGPNSLSTVSGNYFINLMHGNTIHHTLYLFGMRDGTLTSGQTSWHQWAKDGNQSTYTVINDIVIPRDGKVITI